VLAISRYYPLSSCPAEQVALPHQTQYFLVVNDLAFMLKLLGNPPITVAGKFQTDGFDTVGDVGIPSGRTGFAAVIKRAPGDLHQTAPPPDAADEVFPLADDFPFL